MPPDRSNILELVLYRDRRLKTDQDPQVSGGASGAPACGSGGRSWGGSASGCASASAGASGGERSGDCAGDPHGELQAIVSCLEYLYGETIKLDRRMAAHLIGAAAEALRPEAAQPTDRSGGEQ